MGNGTCADDRGQGEALGLGCDFGAIPACSRAMQDIDDFVSWDIDHLKVGLSMEPVHARSINTVLRTDP
jgi:hypothetical protein